MNTFDLLLKGGTVVSHAGEGLADIGVRGGRIAAIGDLAAASAGATFDAKGLHVLPGVIDTQVHFREPGNTHKEDLETGTRAAALERGRRTGGYGARRRGALVGTARARRHSHGGAVRPPPRRRPAAREPVLVRSLQQ